MEYRVVIWDQVRRGRGGKPRFVVKARHNGKVVAQITTSDPLKNFEKLNEFFRRKPVVDDCVERCDPVLL